MVNIISRLLAAVTALVLTAVICATMSGESISAEPQLVTTTTTSPASRPVSTTESVEATSSSARPTTDSVQPSPTESSTAPQTRHRLPITDVERPELRMSATYDKPA